MEYLIQTILLESQLDKAMKMTLFLLSSQMDLSAMMVITRPLNLEKLKSQLMVVYIKSKDHLVKSHKLFNKIKLFVKTWIVMMLSLLLRKEVLMLGRGLVKVLVKKKQLMLNHLDLFFNQMLLLPKLKRDLNQKNSGLL